MSRVRNWSRVAIPTGVAGFGLVETLVVAGVSLTLGYGIIKTSLVGMQTNAIVHTSLKEQDLIHTVRTTLGNPDQCKYNLKPSALTTAGTPPKTTVSEIKNTGPDKSVTTDDISLIKAGENFKNNPLIHIQRMELSGTTEDRTFILYYKKPQLGSLSSPGTCTDLDPSGCYFIACKMDYDCSTDDDCSPTGSGVCNPRNCAEGGAVAGVDTARVNAIIRSRLATNNLLCPETEEGKKKFLKGLYIDPDENLAINCDTPPEPETNDIKKESCPAGQVMKGIKPNGDPDCTLHCTGGRRLYERHKVRPAYDTMFNYYDYDYYYYLVGVVPLYLYYSSYVVSKKRLCMCSAEQGWKNGNCVTCEGDKKWDTEMSQCITCSGGGAYWSNMRLNSGFNSICKCSSPKKKKSVAQWFLAYPSARPDSTIPSGYVARLIKGMLADNARVALPPGGGRLVTCAAARPDRVFGTGYVARLIKGMLADNARVALLPEVGMGTPADVWSGTSISANNVSSALVKPIGKIHNVA